MVFAKGRISFGDFAFYPWFSSALVSHRGHIKFSFLAVRDDHGNLCPALGWGNFHRLAIRSTLSSLPEDTSVLVASGTDAHSAMGA